MGKYIPKKIKGVCKYGHNKIQDEVTGAWVCPSCKEIHFKLLKYFGVTKKKQLTAEQLVEGATIASGEGYKILTDTVQYVSRADAHVELYSRLPENNLVMNYHTPAPTTPEEKEALRQERQADLFHKRVHPQNLWVTSGSGSLPSV